MRANGSIKLNKMKGTFFLNILLLGTLRPPELDVGSSQTWLFAIFTWKRAKTGFSKRVVFQKGGFPKEWFWRKYPRSGFSFWGNMRTYPCSGFRSGGTSECTLVPVFVPEKDPPEPPFWKTTLLATPTFALLRLHSFALLRLHSFASICALLRACAALSASDRV